MLAPMPTSEPSDEVSGLEILNEVREVAEAYARERPGATVRRDEDGMWIAVSGTGGTVKFEMTSPSDRSIKIRKPGEEVGEEQKAVRINSELWSADSPRRPIKQVVQSFIALVQQ